MRFSHRSTGNDSTRVKGCTVLAQIANLGTYGSNANASQFALNPMNLGDNDVNLEAQRWLKFRFNRVRCIWAPNASTSTVGSLYFTLLADPEVRLPDQGVLDYTKACMALSPAAAARPIWLPFDATFDLDRASRGSRATAEPRQFYYIAPDEDNDARFTVQAMLLLNTAMTAGAQGGTWYLEYEIDFAHKAYNKTNFTANTAALSCSGGLSAPVQIDTTVGTWEASTPYCIYLTRAAGSLRPNTLYYFTTEALLTTPADVYEDPNGHTLAEGTWLPFSETVSCYSIHATSMAPPGVRRPTRAPKKDAPKDPPPTLGDGLLHASLLDAGPRGGLLLRADLDTAAPVQVEMWRGQIESSYWAKLEYDVPVLLYTSQADAIAELDYVKGTCPGYTEPVQIRVRAEANSATHKSTMGRGL